MSDPENLPRWQRNILESERTSRGPMTAGATFRQALDVGGRRVELLCVVTGFAEDERLSFIYDAREGASFEIDFFFEPIDGGTMLTGKGVGRLRSLYALFEPLVKGEIGEQVEANLNDPKGFLEGCFRNFGAEAS